MRITCTYRIQAYIHIYIFFFPFFFYTPCERHFFALYEQRAPLKIAVDNFARQISIIFAIGGWQIGDRAVQARSNDDDSRGTINGSPCGWYSCGYTRTRCARKYMVAEYESPVQARNVFHDVWVCVSRVQKNIAAAFSFTDLFPVA